MYALRIGRCMTCPLKALKEKIYFRQRTPTIIFPAGSEIGRIFKISFKLYFISI